MPSAISIAIATPMPDGRSRGASGRSAWDVRRSSSSSSPRLSVVGLRADARAAVPAKESDAALLDTMAGGGTGGGGPAAAGAGVLCLGGGAGGGGGGRGAGGGGGARPGGGRGGGGAPPGGGPGARGGGHA